MSIHRSMRRSSWSPRPESSRRTYTLALAFATDKRHIFEATVNRPNRNGLLGKGERQDTVIVGDTSVGLVRALYLSIELVAIVHFGKTADDHLGRQAVVSLDPLVHQVVQIVLPKDLLIPRDTANRVARGVRCFKRARQSISVFGGGVQLDLGNNFIY